MNEIISDKLSKLTVINFDISDVKKENINLQFKPKTNEKKEIHKIII